MDSFLESAQKLEVEGLLATDNKDEINEEKNSIQDEVIPEETYDDFKYQQDEEKQVVKIDQTVNYVTRRQQSKSYPTDLTKFDVGSCTPEEIEDKIRNLYEKKDGVFRCLACGYTTNHKIKRHIEVHFEGLSYPCTVCNKEFRSKNSLNNHESIKHH